MVWEFQCPAEDCTFSSSGNKEDRIVENAQQHMRDTHGDMPTRDEVEAHLVGPG